MESRRRGEVGEEEEEGNGREVGEEGRWKKKREGKKEEKKSRPRGREKIGDEQKINKRKNEYGGAGE